MPDHDQAAAILPEKPPLHLRLGLIGRRNLSKAGASLDAAALRAMRLCAGALRQVGGQRGAYHRPGPWHFTAITALAEGADQRLAGLWLQQCDVGADGADDIDIVQRLEVVLPFAPDGYAGTMSAKAAAAMREFCGKADSLLELADRNPTAELDPTDVAEKRFRDQRYAALADIIVRQADIVLALWDGAPNVDLGGTSHLISRALRDGVPVLWLDIETSALRLLLPREQPIGDVLLAAKQAAPLPKNEAVALAAVIQALAPALDPLWQPQGQGQGSATPHQAGKADARAELDRFFNRPETGPARSSASPYSLLLWLTGSLVKQASGEAITRQWLGRWPGLRLECDGVRKRFAEMPQKEAWHWWHFPSEAENAWGHADAAATALGHLYRSSYVTIFVLGALAVLVGLFGVPLKEYKAAAVALELLLLLLAGGIFLHQKRCRVHERFMHLRGMAEAFRPAFMLMPLGLAGRRMRRNAADWPVWLMQAHVAAAGLPRARLDAARLREVAEAMRQHVVENQLGYHRQNAARMHLLDHALERLAQSLVALAVLAALAYLAAYSICGKAMVAPFAGWLTLLLAGMPALAGALAAIRYHGDFERFSNRSERTAAALEYLAAELRQYTEAMATEATHPADPFGTLRDILLALEKVLLKDVRDWNFVYRVRHTPEPA